MLKRCVVLIFAFAVCPGLVTAQRAYINDIEKWRTAHEAETRSDSGWLSLAGLFWLHKGTNTVGSGDGYAVTLTNNFTHGNFGVIEFDGSKATLSVDDGVEATVEGEPVKTIELISDEKGKPTVVQTGSQTFFLIKRENRYGIRLRDKDSPKLKAFNGLHWYPIDPGLRITAAYVPFPEVKEVLIPNVLGGNFKYKSPGLLKFRIKGKDYSLQPVEENEKTLFIVFRDLSSKGESYGAGRFLYTERPVNGKVILDFNKAENPPCAYTSFATCPLPPPQNRLNVDLRAGEKKYDH
jgi:uncharacterized protein (DUF1684 family)